MDIVNLMNEAWDNRLKYSHEECEERFKNLLSHAFVSMEEIFSRRIPDYDEDVFYSVQKIIAALALADGEFLQGEYDAYLKFCDWANFEPLSVSEFQNLGNDVTGEEVLGEIEALASIRSEINEDDYYCFVLGLGIFALLGDREIDEIEYYIIANFFTYDTDYAPDWEQFKRDWL